MPARPQPSIRRRRARLVVLLAFLGGLAAVAAVVLGSGDRHRAKSATTKARAQGRRTHTAKQAAAAPARGSYRGPVPILMYHVVTAPPAGTAYPELWTPRETFRATIALLARRGYRGVTLEQAWRAWHGGPGLPAHPVVVSFDDGYLSQYTHAKPALRAVGWPGVLNLEGKNIGPGGLTRHQLRQLLAAGWEIDSHTLSHPDLTTLDEATLRNELSGSRSLLRSELHVAADFLCYPSGRNDARVRAAARAAGYLAATTVEPGIATRGDDPFSLPRIRVSGTDSPATVLERVRSGAGASGGGGG